MDRKKIQKLPNSFQSKKLYVDGRFDEKCMVSINDYCPRRLFLAPSTCSIFFRLFISSRSGRNSLETSASTTLPKFQAPRPPAPLNTFGKNGTAQRDKYKKLNCMKSKRDSNIEIQRAAHLRICDSRKHASHACISDKRNGA